MTLYELHHSPFCIPIRRILDAARVPYQSVAVPNHDRSELLRLTGGAYYEVPMLEHEGRVIFESGLDTQDLPRYVDNAFCGGRLFPTRHEGLQAILIAHLENEVEGATFRLADIYYVPSISDPLARGMVIRHKERKFGRGCVDAWRRDRDTLWHNALRILTPFDQMASQSPFLLGGQPVYADFLLYGILGNLTCHNWNPFPPLPALQAWRQRMEAFEF